MQWRAQTRDSNCGQTAIACIAHLEINEVERLMGHGHATRTREIVKVLRRLGFECPNKLIRTKRGLYVYREFEPGTYAAVCKLRHPKSHRFHWVVMNSIGAVSDGWHGIAGRGICAPFLCFWPEGVQITSYLPVRMHKV